MPAHKYNTPEEKKAGHNAAALRYSRINKKSVDAANLARYHKNKDTINAKRREKYAEKKRKAALA